MNDQVRVSLDLAVSADRAFEVFTRDLDAWWQRGPKYRFVAPFQGRLVLEPGVGGRLIHRHDDGGTEDWIVGEVRAWEPGRRLLLSWRLPNFQPDQSTEVEVRFHPREDGCRIEVEHRGWSKLPIDHPANHGLRDRELLLLRGGWWSSLLRPYCRLLEHP